MGLLTENLSLYSAGPKELDISFPTQGSCAHLPHCEQSTLHDLELVD